MVSSRFVESEDCYEVVVACYPDGREVQQKAEWIYHVDGQGHPVPGSPALKASGRWVLPQDWVRRANERMVARQYQEVIADCNRALELDPKYAPAYNLRGAALDAMERYHEAVADYTRAIQLDPNGTGSYYNGRGLAYQMLGRQLEANRDFARARDLGKRQGG